MDTKTDQIDAQLHGMWAAVAPAWAEHADYVDARATTMTTAMLEPTDPQPGERVLELACGPGGLGLAAAPLVAPGGDVVLSDVVPEMTAIAAARARGLGIENASTAELDLEQIEQPDDTFDIVLCREGLMFARDPERAVREIRRVLRPGGRIAISVWGPRARNPWLSVVLDAVSAELGVPVPPPGVPGPFSLDDPATFAALFAVAGLVGVSVSEVSVPLRTGSFEEWWSRTSSLAGPLTRLLASLPETVTNALEVRLRDAVRAVRDGRGLRVPGCRAARRRRALIGPCQHDRMLRRRPKPTVAIIGAGAGGIAMGIRLRRAGYDFTIYEKSDGVGGTWRDNDYPGAACDVPSHLYSFSFELNPWWSRTYATQPEILAYLERCTDQYGVRPHVRTGVAITTATWDEPRAAVGARIRDRRDLHRRRGGERTRHAERSRRPRHPRRRPVPRPLVPLVALGPQQVGRR